MDYLTTYYRNLSEQLQNKLFELQETHKLVEANLRGPEELRNIGLQKGVEASQQMVDAIYRNPNLGQRPNARQIAFAGGMEAAKQAQKPYSEKADKRQEQIAAALNMIPEAAYFDDHDAVRSLTKVISAMHGVQHSLGDPTAEDYRLFASVHSGEYQPMRPEPEDFSQEQSPQQSSNEPMDSAMISFLKNRRPILRGS